VTYWHQFLDSLDSPGGHIAVLLALLAAGIGFGIMELHVFAMGALATILRPALSNHARQNGTGGSV